MTPVIAENGEEAVRLYMEANGKFDLILMDFEMPLLDGYAATEAIRRLEAENQWPATPIHGLSAHAIAEYHARAISAGMNDCISKPIKIERLQHLLETLAHS
jgi:CheY-like chemotaxis protein